MEDDELLSVLRGMIAHEDDLRDQRLGWLFALNGFLFAAVGLAWGQAGAAAFVSVLAILGIVVAVSVAASLRVNEVAIGSLAALAHPALDRAAARGASLPPAIGARSHDLRAAGGLAARAPVLYPWRVVPWCLVLVWIAVAAVAVIA